MSTASDQSHLVRRRTLETFSKAWAEKDLDRLMSCLTEDCVYAASVGPEPGLTFSGKTAVREGVARMIALDNTLRTEVFDLVFYNDKASWQWRYFCMDQAGLETIEHGCDFFTFVSDKISMKNAFRKLRT